MIGERMFPIMIQERLCQLLKLNIKESPQKVWRNHDILQKLKQLPKVTPLKVLILMGILVLAHLLLKN